MAGNAAIDADVAVVGAGVVGLAVAARLAERHDVVVIERNHACALETSAHNTGIVHAGLFYETGSLKHRLCLEAVPMVYEWCAARGVRVERTGKLIVALAPDEIGGLDALEARAAANGVPGVRRLTAREAAALEPAVPAVEALHSETSGVIDQAGFARSLEAAAIERGALLAYRHRVDGAQRDGDRLRLALRGPEGEAADVACRVLVNAAGHGAPAIAAALGYPLDGGEGVPVMRQRVNRGRYYDLVGAGVARAVARPVYPIPAPRQTVLAHQARAGGLGLHLGVDIDGALHLGPDTAWLPDGAPLDYRADDTAREAFLAAGRRLLPGLAAEDLAPGQVGYRPKLAVAGDAPPDFVIWADRGYVHLGGIESPGLTSALAIARAVGDLVA